MFANLRPAPDRELALVHYDALARDYDNNCRNILDIRRAAIDALRLGEGETVFDVACGTGTMLPLLAQRLGKQGRIVGIEQSLPMLAVARQRIKQEQLSSNVSLLGASVEEAQLTTQADALLFCYTHDVLQSPTALENIFRSTRLGARVVVAGAKFLPWCWGAPINLWTCWRGRKYLTTFKGLNQPWLHLLTYCPDLAMVRTFHAGTSYLAYGTFSGAR